MAAEIRLEPVSMGKGFVEWRVVYLALAKKNPAIGTAYDDVVEACRAVKRHSLREQVDPETVTLIEEHAADCAWGSDRSDSGAHSRPGVETPQ